MSFQLLAKNEQQSKDKRRILDNHIFSVAALYLKLMQIKAEDYLFSFLLLSFTTSVSFNAIALLVSS